MTRTPSPLAPGPAARRRVARRIALLVLAAFTTGAGAEEPEQPVAAATEEKAEGAESDDPATHVHDEIVVTGTRARQRSITESMAPIDVISSEHVAHRARRIWTSCCATWCRR